MVHHIILGPIHNTRACSHALEKEETDVTYTDSSAPEQEQGVQFFPPRILASTGFLSLWDLASTGFLIGFSVFCTDYGQYWFSNILRIFGVLVFL